MRYRPHLKPDAGRYRGVIREDEPTLRPPRPAFTREPLDEKIDALAKALDDERPSVEVHVHNGPPSGLAKAGKASAIVAALVGLLAAIDQVIRLFN